MVSGRGEVLLVIFTLVVIRIQDLVHVVVQPAVDQVVAAEASSADVFAKVMGE